MTRDRRTLPEQSQKTQIEESAPPNQENKQNSSSNQSSIAKVQQEFSDKKSQTRSFRDISQWNPFTEGQKTEVERKVAEDSQSNQNTKSTGDVKKIIQQEQANVIAEKSARVLFRCKSLFPFDLFPDEFTIDQLKVTKRQREFFSSEAIHSVLISDISHVEVTYAGFLARLIIKRSNGEYVSVGNLKKKDALKAKQIIQGIIVAKSQNIELGMLSVPEIVDKLQKLGQ